MGSGMKENKVGKRGAEHVGPKKRKVEWSKEGKRRESKETVQCGEIRALKRGERREEGERNEERDRRQNRRE